MFNRRIFAPPALPPGAVTILAEVFVGESYEAGYFKGSLIGGSDFGAVSGSYGIGAVVGVSTEYGTGSVKTRIYLSGTTVAAVNAYLDDYEYFFVLEGGELHAELLVQDADVSEPAPGAVLIEWEGGDYSERFLDGVTYTTLFY